MSETLNPAESTPSVDSTTPTTEPIVASSQEATPVQATESTPPPPDAKEQTQAPSASGDKDANKKASLLDVVKAAYNKASPDPSSSTGGTTDPAKGTTTEAKASLDDGKTQTDDSDKAAEKLPFHNHPRWKEMLTEREALKPRAEQYDKIVSFMTTNSLSPNEMADGMRVMALMKHNPTAAYEQLQTYIKKLAPYTGEELSPEMRAKVDDGFVDPETAKELSRLKAEKEFLNQRSEEIYQQQVAQQQASSQRAMYDAVTGWEATEKARDPDWSAKYEMVQDRVRSLMATTKPASPEEAVQLARRALSDVNDRLRPLAGRTTNIRPPVSSMSSATSRPVARSLEDIVRMGLQT